jgi:hypothetical protein
MERALKIREHKNNVIDHYDCVKRVFSLYTSVERLTEIKELPDVNTLCAYEYHKMKKNALSGGLDFKEFHPEHYKGLKLPH